MSDNSKDVLDLKSIIEDQEALSRQLDNEAEKLFNKNMNDLAKWKEYKAIKYKQIADWLKELDSRRLRESLDE